MWIGGWWLFVFALVLMAALSARSEPVACRSGGALTGSFWLVTTPTPKLCLPPLAPWRALPGASAEIVVEHDAEDVASARGRWTAPGRAASAWSATGAPFKMLPPGVAPDADGNGLVTIGADGTAFVRDWFAGDPARFDFDANGIISAADGRLFLGFVGGQVLR